MTRWLDPPFVEIPASFSTLNLPPLIAQTLVRRGITRPEEAEAFLHPEKTPLVPVPGIEQAADLIHMAIRNQERICIWGDFDVDGQTSTALLVQALQTLGANVVSYIPIRGKESHGVHLESLKPILDHGIRLLVTCDTGITAHEAIDYAHSRGVQVVVTDHHDPGETLPNAQAVINPKLLPEGHPLKNLAGVGVAYKLAEELLDRGRWTVDREQPSTVHGLRSEDLLDLVALGLIADVALLTGETRTLVQKGIRALRSTQRLGLKIMAELAGAALETLTEETIGFTFAPRLNALGRLSDANPAVELLTTNNAARARVIAAQIEGLNAQRRLLTSQVTEAAEALLRADPSLLSEPALLLAHPNWPGGVIGIVANRLAERYHKPTLLLTETEDGILRGSARSIEGLHITAAIAANKELLLGFGGHPMAAGLSLTKENLPAFRKGLNKAIEKQLGEIVREEPTLQIDAWLTLDEVNLTLAEGLELLAPFGAGNPELTLATRRVTLKSAQEIGKTREHLRLTVEDESGRTQSLLWWNGAGEELPETTSRVDIAYSVRASTYRGQRQVTLQFKEFRITEETPIEIQQRRTPQIRDLRAQPAALNLQPSTLIWAEGPDRAAGIPRHELRQAAEFSIYTTPPSPADLRRALEIVQPEIVYVFGISPPPQKTDEFLTYLAGLCKYVLNQRGGKVTLSELAAATAARASAVRIGLEWLAAGGHLSVSGEGEALLLSRGNGEANPYLQKELYIALRGILEETAAYRAYFATADIHHLIEWE
jgi:single-stranded-DNA-specific exonuclease